MNCKSLFHNHSRMVPAVILPRANINQVGCAHLCRVDFNESHGRRIATVGVNMIWWHRMQNLLLQSLWSHFDVRYYVFLSSLWPTATRAHTGSISSIRDKHVLWVSAIYWVASTREVNKRGHIFALHYYCISPIGYFLLAELRLHSRTHSCDIFHFPAQQNLMEFHAGQLWLRDIVCRIPRPEVLPF